MSLMDKIYDIMPERNRPQFVYGVPDEMLKKWEKEDKNDVEVFSAYEGGYFGPSYYYFINKIDEKYQFRFAYSEDSKPIENDINNPRIKHVDHNKEYYDTFIKELLDAVKNWNNVYDNDNVMDGTEWHINFTNLNKSFVGSNDFPDNYEAAKLIIDKYFNSQMLINDSSNDKYDINPEDNVPYEVYGIPDAIKNRMKYNINPEDNVPQKVYGVPNSSDKIDYYTYKISIKNDVSNYILALNHYLNPSAYDLIFQNLNELSDKTVADLSVRISEFEYNTFKNRLYNIVESWNSSYTGSSNINWSLKIDDENENIVFYGNGDYPKNWNDLIDLLSEYEIMFKTKLDKNKKLSNDELAEKYLKEIEEEVDQELIKLGLLNIYEGKKIPVFGSCHVRWGIEKKILKERFGIDWKTPAEKNPNIEYD